MAKKYQYIVDLKADTSKFEKKAGGIGNLLKPVAAAAAGLFAADKIKDAAVEIFNFGKEIDGVRNSVQQLTGLSGGVLNNVTGEIKAIGDVYKKDYQQILETGNTLAKEFGKTNTAALDLIKDGFLTGADASGEFLDQVREYSTQFKAAGYSASEMVAIISQSTKAGIFSDKGADTIKEATLRIREMTTATRSAIDNTGLSSTEIEKKLADGTYKVSDVIKIVSARLNELPETSSKVGTAIADIFGGPGEDAGLEFIKTLKDVELNLDKLKEKSSDQAKANKALVESQQRLNTTAAAIFGGMNTSMAKAKTTMYNFINDSLKYGVELVNWFIDLYNESVIFRIAVQYVGFSFKNLWLIVKTVFKQIWNVIKTTGKALANLLAFDFSGLKDTIAQGFKTTLNLYTDFGKKTAENFKKAVENALSREKIEYVKLDDAKEQAETAGKNSSDSFAKGLTSKPIKVPKLEIGPVKPVIDWEDPVTEDLFDPETMLGNSNRLSAMLAEVNDEFQKAADYAKLYGDESTLYADKQNILTDSIKTLIDEGYSAEGEAIQSLIKMKDELAEKDEEQANRMQLMKDINSELGTSLQNTAEQGADSFEEMGKNMLNTIRSVISGFIAKGVAAALAESMATLPFPLNVIGAPTVAAMASTAFNSLIPAFAEGGMVYGPTMGLMGEYPGAKSNPEVIAPLNKLKGIIRQDSINVPDVVVIKAKGGDLEGVLQFRNRKRKSYQ